MALALRLTGLGWYVAICIVVGVVGGLGLDKLAGTLPLFTLLGTGLGSIVAFWGRYKMIQAVRSGTKSGGSTDNRGEQ